MPIVIRLDVMLARRKRREISLPAPEEGSRSLIGRSPAMQEVYRVIARVVSNQTQASNCLASEATGISSNRSSTAIWSRRWPSLGSASSESDRR